MFRNGLVRNATHITAIGADCARKQELPTQFVVAVSLLVCDLLNQSLKHGELQAARLQNPALQVLELGHIISGKEIGRLSGQEITIVDLTGIEAQDIAIAQTIIDAAQTNKRVE